MGDETLGHSYVSCRETTAVNLAVRSQSNSCTYDPSSCEPVLRAKALVAFQRGDYQKTVEILESNAFQIPNHDMLQDLWFRSHYAIAEQVHVIVFLHDNNNNNNNNNSNINNNDNINKNKKIMVE